MRGICVNHGCPRFEHRVAVSDDLKDAETERCPECSQLLCHESGLTFRDAYRAECATNLANAKDDYEMLEAEGAIYELLEIPLDETEQGPTQAATDALEAFMTATLGRPWTYVDLPFSQSPAPRWGA